MAFPNTDFQIVANGHPGKLRIGNDGATGTMIGTGYNNDPVDMFVADRGIITFRRTMMPAGKKSGPKTLKYPHQYYTGVYMQAGGTQDYLVVASGTFTEDNDAAVYTWKATSEPIPG